MPDVLLPFNGGICLKGQSLSSFLPSSTKPPDVVTNPFFISFSQPKGHRISLTLEGELILSAVNMLKITSKSISRLRATILVSAHCSVLTPDPVKMVTNMGMVKSKA